MPMNEEVRKAVDELSMWVLRSGDQLSECDEWTIIVAELTRLTEIADSVDPLVVRLGEVTAELEAAAKENERLNAWIIEYHKEHRAAFLRDRARSDKAEALLRECLTVMALHPATHHRIQAHLSEPRT